MALPNLDVPQTAEVLVYVGIEFVKATVAATTAITVQEFVSWIKHRKEERRENGGKGRRARKSNGKNCRAKK